MVESGHETVFDTGQQHLGAVYAKALLGATEKAGNSDTVLDELESLVADVLAKLPQLEAALSSPRVPLAAKEAILNRAFHGKMTLQLLNLLKVLARRGRFDCLRAIAQAARKQLNDLRGRVRVHVRSAAALDEPTRELIANRLQAALGREVDLRLHVHPELIGGLVVRVGDTVYDGSLKNRLSRLRAEMVAKAAEKMRGQLDRFVVTP